MQLGTYEIINCATVKRYKIFGPIMILMKSIHGGENVMKSVIRLYNFIRHRNDSAN